MTLRYFERLVFDTDNGEIYASIEDLASLLNINMDELYFWLKSLQITYLTKEVSMDITNIAQRTANPINVVTMDLYNSNVIQFAFAMFKPKITLKEVIDNIENQIKSIVSRDLEEIQNIAEEIHRKAHSLHTLTKDSEDKKLS